MSNWLTIAIGVLLSSTGVIAKRRTGQIDWLYLILGIMIILIGIFRLLGLIKLTF